MVSFQVRNVFSGDGGESEDFLGTLENIKCRKLNTIIRARHGVVLRLGYERRMGVGARRERRTDALLGWS